MEYTVQKLAALSGATPRALRYYDRIGLLRPARGENGYRLYGPEQVDALQQILFYRELGLGLEEIRRLLAADEAGRARTLESHLTALEQERERLATLITTVRRTLRAGKGEEKMSDREKFEGFRREYLAETAQRYGAEARKKYGDAAVDASERKLETMTEQEWKDRDTVEQEMFALLRTAMEKGDPGCPEALRACELHRRWLCAAWKAGTYTKAAHRAMGEMYCADERFRAYYDGALGPGGTEFLQAAPERYTA